MADGPALALQKALIATLKADAGVAALVAARVYDEPPQKATRPFIRLGDIDRAPLRADGVPTDADIAFVVEVHSRPIAGRVEATRIAEAVVAALDEQEDSLSPVGFPVIRCQYVTTGTTRAADGKSYESRIVFQALLDASAP